MGKAELLRELKSVDELLRSSAGARLCAVHGQSAAAAAIRAALSRTRAAVLSGMSRSVSMEAVLSMAEARLACDSAPGLRPVVNASGTVLHTNLGRAVLPPEVTEAVVLAASSPVDLEFDLQGAARGERDLRIEELLCRLTGAEAALVVNNNAAAVLIALNTLADGKDVVISRGELIEIGGSFRLPEIIKKSGCVLKEVGTTNRTHAADYESAVNADTALILKAHKSNYGIVGFSSEVDIAELAAIGAKKGVPVVEDLGSGSLIDLTRFGIKKEPVVGERLKAGADIVTFSGDKLLGGPQAGLIVGKKDCVERMRKNPLKRALRADKLTIAALDATLRLYLNPDTICDKLPTLKALSRPISEIEAAALSARDMLRERLGQDYTIEVEDGESLAGSGSMPEARFPTKVVSITHPKVKAEAIFKAFLTSSTPILGRVSKEKFLLDLRTVSDVSEVVPDNYPPKG